MVMSIDSSVLSWDKTPQFVMALAEITTIKERLYVKVKPEMYP